MPMHLDPMQNANLATFDTLDLEIFSHADWARLGQSHAQNIPVHWPDGQYTEGIDWHIADLAALFVWAPDTRINLHPTRIAHDFFTAVTGVMRGTFTRPMPNPAGGVPPAPTGRAYAINMCTVGWVEPPGHHGRGVPLLGRRNLLPADRPGLSAGPEGRARTGHG